MRKKILDIDLRQKIMPEKSNKCLIGVLKEQKTKMRQ